MLADGTNPEGIDPDPPLNWTKDTFSSSKVVLHGLQASPAVCKIITYLKYFKIRYEHRAAPGKSGTDYKKMPVLDVAERQVNDSAIITKFMVPALVGPQAFNEEWEKKITF